MKSETASCCSTYAAPRYGVHHSAFCDCRPGDECHHENSVQHLLPLLFPLAAIGAFALFALDDALAIFRCSDSLRHFVALAGHGVLLPIFARPIASREFRFFLVAFVSRSERFASLWVRLLYPHVWITEAHQLYVASLFGEDGELLVLAGGSFRFVVS